MQLAGYLAASIIQAVKSVECSRVNFRKNSGDIILDITDGMSDLVLHVDSQLYNPKEKPFIHQGFIRFKDEEFALTRPEIKNINLSESICGELQKFMETDIVGAKTEEV